MKNSVELNYVKALSNYISEMNKAEGYTILEGIKILLM